MYTEFYCAMEALEDFEECLDLVLKDHSILEEAKGRSGSPVTGCGVKEYSWFLTCVS